jgi:hypothetical protein
MVRGVVSLLTEQASRQEFLFYAHRTGKLKHKKAGADFVGWMTMLRRSKAGWDRC